MTFSFRITDLGCWISRPVDLQKSSDLWRSVPDYVSVTLPLQWISKLHWGGFHWMKRLSFDRKALVRGFRQLCMSKKVRLVLHITCLPATVIRDQQFACDRRFKIYFSISLYFEKIQSNWTERSASDHGHSVQNRWIV